MPALSPFLSVLFSLAAFLPFLPRGFYSFPPCPVGHFVILVRWTRPPVPLFRRPDDSDAREYLILIVLYAPDVLRAGEETFVAEAVEG